MKTSSEESKLPLLELAPLRKQGSFTGVLQVRRVRTYSGCTVPPTDNDWAVLEFKDYVLPLTKVTQKEAADLVADKKPAPVPPRPWTRSELEKQGWTAGSKVAVDGSIGPIVWSGTEALSPVYGFFITDLRAETAASELTAVGPALTVSKPTPPSTAAKQDDKTESSDSIDSLFDQIRAQYLRLGTNEKDIDPVLRQMREAMKSVPEAQARRSLIEMRDRLKQNGK